MRRQIRRIALHLRVSSRVNSWRVHSNHCTPNIWSMRILPERCLHTMMGVVHQPGIAFIMVSQFNQSANVFRVSLPSPSLSALSMVLHLFLIVSPLPECRWVRV